MTFSTNEQLHTAFAGGVVKPFAEVNIQQAAYELGVAHEYAMTSLAGEGERRRIADGDDIVIPPGQFALLLTEEIVNIPAHAMGLISVKASWKLRGLVNVSGFHVDPGFHGRLRFAVYNASGQTLRMKPGRRLFQLWLNRLSEPLPEKALYKNKLPPDAGIQDDDVTAIAGMVASPAGLSARIGDLGERLTGELPKLEASLSKTVADKCHELAIHVKEDNNKLSERLGGEVASLRAWQKAQWVFIAILFLVVITEPLKSCGRADSKTSQFVGSAAQPIVPQYMSDAAVAASASPDAAAVAPAQMFDAMP
jgi:dCTP deaminase